MSVDYCSMCTCVMGRGIVRGIVHQWKYILSQDADSLCSAW
jgi:hypothetical protein